MNSIEVGSMGTPLLELTSTSLTGDANLKTVSYKGCGALCHLLRDVSLFLWDDSHVTQIQFFAKLESISGILQKVTGYFLKVTA